MKRGVHSRLFCQHGHSLQGDNVYVSARGARSCKACVLALSMKKYKNLNPKEKEKLLERQRIRNTGRSPEEYHMVYTSQDGLCAICEQPEPRGLLHSDHNHETGQRRGFLCQRCNQGIGFIGIPEVLRKAADYLEYWGNRDNRTIGAVVSKTYQGRKLSAS